jgi:hypothetical protein
VVFMVIFWPAATARKALIIRSRLKSKTTSTAETLCSGMSIINAAVTRSLSATGSKNWPVLVSTL